MSDIKVTQAEIDLLLNSADVQVRTEFGKCTVVTVRLRNGFILTESSACVDPAAEVCIVPEDVAALLALLKIARIATGHGKSDNWVDLAGYAACGGELQSRPAVCGK